jgi:hypothetical protein
MNRYWIGVATGVVLAIAFLFVRGRLEEDHEGEPLDVICEGQACSAIGIECPGRQCKMSPDGSIYFLGADGKWEAAGLNRLRDESHHQSGS